MIPSDRSIIMRSLLFMSNSSPTQTEDRICGSRQSNLKGTIGTTYTQRYFFAFSFQDNLLRIIRLRQLVETSSRSTQKLLQPLLCNIFFSNNSSCYRIFECEENKLGTEWLGEYSGRYFLPSLFGYQGMGRAIAATDSPASQYEASIMGFTTHKKNFGSPLLATLIKASLSNAVLGIGLQKARGSA